jgi:hypothetical protein
MPNGRFIGGCWQCKAEMWLPQELYDAAMHGRSRITFFCAYGHGQVFAEGESEEAKLRRERDRLLQRTVQLDDARVEAERRLAVAQDVLNRERLAATKAKKRSIAGTCPCCHRTFRQMALHMRNKHPEFKAEIAAA